MTERASIKKILRPFLPILLFGCMAVLVACGNEGENNDVTDPADSTAQAEQVEPNPFAEGDLGKGITFCYDTALWAPINLVDLEAFEGIDPEGTAILTDKLDRGQLHTVSYSAIYYPGDTPQQLQERVGLKMDDVHTKLFQLDSMFYSNTLVLDSLAPELNGFDVSISNFDYPGPDGEVFKVNSMFGARAIGPEHVVLLSLESQIYTPEEIEAEFNRLTQCVRFVDQ